MVALKWVGRNAAARALLCCVVMAAAGCGDADPPEPSPSLVDHASWAVVDAADDPFAAAKPAQAVCDSFGYSAEEFEDEAAFFVDTASCDFLTVEQPALLKVSKGDTLHLRLYHFDLTAPAGGEAHLAIAVAGSTMWERRIGIPGDAALIETTWSAQQDIAQGTPVLFHVNNHGDNNYALIELSVMK